VKINPSIFDNKDLSASVNREGVEAFVKAMAKTNAERRSKKLAIYAVAGGVAFLFSVAVSYKVLS
jgi:hypothetical protein